MLRSLYPTFRCRDAHAEIDWLERVLGAERVAVYEDDDGGVAHAEIRVGEGIVMLGSVRDDEGLVTPPGSFSLYVGTTDPDALHARAREAGADVVREPYEQDHGSRDVTLRDPEGNVWSFGTYAPR